MAENPNNARGEPQIPCLFGCPALGLGGHVRKGEHGTTVVYADRFIPDDEKKRARETGEEAQATGPRSPASMPGPLERLRGPGISGTVAPIGASARNLLVRYLVFPGDDCPLSVRPYPRLRRSQF